MQFGIVPTFVSLIFLIVLILVFNFKLKTNNIKDKLFKLYIYISLLFSISEFIFSLTIIHFNNEIAATIMWKIHWFLGSSYWIFLFAYLIVIIKKIQVKTIKDLINYDRILRIILISFMIVPFVTVIVPTSSVSLMIKNHELLFSNKILNIFIMIYCSIVLLSVYIYYFKNRKNVDNTCKFAVYITIFNAICFIIAQTLLPNISLYFTLSVVMAYILYFSFANPDIGLLEEVDLVQKDIELINKTKTDFLANMSYEIKIPIDLITNLCNDISAIDEFKVDEVREELRQIISSGNNLLDIVNNVVDISKIESGRSVLIEKEYNLKDMVDEITNNAISKIGAKNVKFEVNLDENISSKLVGDYSKLYRCLLNVVNNSVKFTNVGKIVFTVTGNKNADYEKLLFKISDTGEGIKEEDKEFLFSKGIKLNSVALEDEGTGVGLSIAKDYVDSLGGKIWFESTYGAGSTFYVEVSQRIKDTTPIKEVKKEVVKDNNDMIDCTGKTILIVDDNRPNVKVIKRLLEKYNFKVDSVLNGQDCIYKVKSDIHYDLIFMDHVMEGMDGIETLRVLKNLQGYTIPPVIVMTANSISDMKDTYIKEGFDDYIAKPVTIRTLNNLISKYFGNK